MTPAKEKIDAVLAKFGTRWPLSHGQEALWTIHRSDPESAAYHVALSLRIRSRFDRDALEDSLRQVVQRHPVLRTRYGMHQGKLFQEIVPDPAPPWRVVDAAGWDEDRLLREVDGEYRIPFDLAGGPVVRPALFTVTEDHHVFLLVAHHIAIDGWSLFQLLDELKSCYLNRTTGRARPLPPAGAPYLEHLLRERALLRSKRGNDLWSYWSKELAGDIPPLQLPTDLPRPPRQTFHGDSRQRTLGPERVARLRTFCKQEGVTPAGTLLACFQILLHRYSRQDDIVVATPSSGRSDSRFERTVGYFVNTLPIRSRFDGAAAFRAFVSSAYQAMRSATEHEGLPFSVLVERLQVKRSPSASPLAQSMFVYQKFPFEEQAALMSGRAGLSWNDLHFSAYPLPQQEGQFEIELEVLDAGDEMHLHFKYNRNLFLPESVERLAGQFELLLEAALVDPTQAVAAIPLMTTDAARALTRPPKNQYAWTMSLGEQFSQAARRFGSRIALTCQGRSLTYRELEERTNQFARHLLEEGVSRQASVGLMLERSIDLIVALIGILKAGAAYVPLDPHNPDDRLKGIIHDVEAAFLVTSRACSKQWAASRAKSIIMESFEDIRDNYPAEFLPIQAREEDVAYILYTSGSTGQPKGVRVTHFNIQRLFLATESIFDFHEEDVWTLFHSYAFDFSVWEIWGALLYGGRAVVVPYGLSRSPERFLTFIEDEGVTVLNQTPSAFRQLMQADRKRPEPAVGSLRWVIFGGEALDIQGLRPWFDRYGDTRPTLVNMYGITETTVHVTHRRIDRNDLGTGASLIGEPIDDLHIVILDEQGQPVPIGVPGEIYVGGGGVSLGYLNRPELNAARFVVQDVFPGQRLYRTGDLARWVSPEDIAYLGRLDHQVQLRGFRVELGEIESHLATHASIETALVVLWERAADDQRLIAYCIPAPGATIQWSDVRSFLRDRLPDYMIPSGCIPVDAFPLNHNGKIAYRDLPPPEQGLDRDPRAGTPRDNLEQRLCGIWEELLSLESIGIHDSFFDAGGHSLLATQLIDRVNAEFEIDLSVDALLSRPTVAELSERIRTEDFQVSPLVPLRTGPRQPPFFCVAGGLGHAAYYQPVARSAGWERTFYGIQAHGIDGTTPPLTSLEEMAARNIEALRSIQPEGPYLLGGHCIGALIAFEMAQQLVRDGATIARLIVMDFPAPLPSYQGSTPAQSEAEWCRALLDVIQISTGLDELGPTLPELTSMTDKQRLAACQSELEAVNVLPRNAGPRPFQGMLHVFRTLAGASYTPALLQPLPITLIKARNVRPPFDFSAADDHPDPRRSSWGWQSLADGALETEIVPGDHISMLMGPHAASLAGVLSRCIKNASREAHPDVGSAHPVSQECHPNEVA